MAIWKPERWFLAFCRRCLGGSVVCVRVVVGGLHGNPKCFVGRVMLCAFSGNSLGFRAVGAFGWIIAHSETLNVHFSGVVWVLIWIWGNLGCVRARRNLERSFCMGGNLGFCGFRGTSGCFRGIWKLERLVWAHRNLGLWCGWKLRGGRVWSFFFSAFRGTRWLLSGIGTSILRFIYTFRSVGGVLSAWQHRAVGGSSDGGVKGIPLNNPHFG